MNNEMIEIFGTIVQETDKALLLFDGREEVWLPLSQIDYDQNKGIGDDLIVEVPEWLCIEKELI